MYLCKFFGVVRVVFVVAGLSFALVSLSPCVSSWAEANKLQEQEDLAKQVEQVMQILDKARESYAKLKDYTALIHKEEYKDGERIKDEETVIKFQKPFKVYLKWLSGKNKGTQLLFVEGKYDNKLIIRKGGGFLKKVFGTMEMDPDGFWLRKFTKHSIREVGFVGVIDTSYNAFKTAQKQGLVSAAQVTMSEVEGRPAYKLVLVVNEEGEENGFYCRSSIQYYDTQSNLPIKATFWLWEDDTAEILTFSDVKLNVKLPPFHFDKENEEYKF